MDAGKLPVAGTAGETAAGLPSVRVSVLIPHYDDLENLSICLDLLDRQTLPRESFEVIVADNNSPVGLAAVSAVVAGRARLVTAPEKGAGPARNVAAAHAHASYLAFIDSDCRPAADWLERGLAALAGADIVGGAVNVTVRDATRPSPVEAFEQAFAFQNQRYVEEKKFSVTCNMFVPRSVFEDVGGFRNHVSEDLDWGQRAASRGYRLIFDGSALIGHPARTDWHALRRKWQRLTRESFYLERGRFARFVWLARSWAVLLSPLFHVYIVARTRSLRGFRARLGAAWILLRIRSFRFAEAHRLMLSAGRSDPQGATVAVRPAPTGEVASSSPHVVIAIVGYRNPDDIRGCLKALSRSRYSNFSIEICENGGAAAYEALIAALGDIAILDATPARPRGARVVRRTDGRLIPGGQSLSLCLAAVNGGYAGGFNICLAEVADGPKWDAIWILNPDTEPDPAALAALVAKSREKDYAIIGSRLLVKRTGRVQLYGGRWRPWIARGFNIGFNAPSESTPDVAAVEREMTYVNGAAMFVPRAFIERVGPMDERYFLYCDEIDWCWRRGSAPLGYAHDSIVLHAHGSTIGSSHSRQDRSALSVYLEERNKLLFTRRFYPVLYPLVVVSTLLLTGQYLAEGAHANFRVALAGWRAGIRGETGMPGWFGRS